MRFLAKTLAAAGVALGLASAPAMAQWHGGGGGFHGGMGGFHGGGFHGGGFHGGFHDGRFAFHRFHHGFGGRFWPGFAIGLGVGALGYPYYAYPSYPYYPAAYSYPAYYGGGYQQPAYGAGYGSTVVYDQPRVVERVIYRDRIVRDRIVVHRRHRVAHTVKHCNC